MMKRNKGKAVALAGLLWVTLLALPASGMARDQFSDEHAFIDLMNGYLGVAEQYVDLAGRREGVIYFAVEGIVEIYEERGEVRAAIPHLERILERHGDDPQIRALVSFKLRDVYRETGQEERALEILDSIVALAAEER